MSKCWGICRNILKASRPGNRLVESSCDGRQAYYVDVSAAHIADFEACFVPTDEIEDSQLIQQDLSTFLDETVSTNNAESCQVRIIFDAKQDKNSQTTLFDEVRCCRIVLSFLFSK
jgi:hypothetical protein